MYSNGIDSLYLMATLIDISEEELEGGVSDPNCLEQALEVCWMPDCTLHFNSLHPNISMYSPYCSLNVSRAAVKENFFHNQEFL